jgi:hypothetical protein
VKRAISVTSPHMRLCPTLWQHWLEESACDVFALMNVGPGYGFALAVYLAALNQAVTEVRTGLKPRRPRLRISSDPILSHPPDVLKLHVILGAIATLPLPSKILDHYAGHLRKCCEQWSDEGAIRLKGTIRLETGQIHTADCALDRTKLEKQAYQVGSYLATARFWGLKDHCMQDLETWDEADEEAANNIKNLFLKMESTNHCPPELLSKAGDGMQLLAGAMAALFRTPTRSHYQRINRLIEEALRWRFQRDPLWGAQIRRPTFEHSYAQQP